VPFFPVAAPAPLTIRGPIAALTIDVQRRRVFAAGARSVAILDADTGKVLATIRIGGVRSFALEPLGGHVLAGTQDGHISELDPERKAVVRSVDAGAPAEVLLYDAVSGRLYADGGGRAALTAVDAGPFTPAAPVALSGRVPGQLAPDPVTREIYAAFADRPEIAILDARGSVLGGFPTPGVPPNSVVRFDSAFGQIVVLGRNGVLDVYDRAGLRRDRIAVPAGSAACELDPGDHVLACTGPGGLTFVQLARQAAPQLIASREVAAPALVALDAKTHDAVVVRSNPDGSGANVQHFSLTAVPSPVPSPRERP
jgi:hypothetical protein